MDIPLIALLVAFAASAFATLGSVMARLKKRRPHEGLFLGLFLGPIGLVIEAMLPTWTRPIVDEGSLHSFRSMVTYQASDRSPRKSAR